MPRFIIFGGPNGAGKSTNAKAFLEKHLEFVSIDGDAVLRELKQSGGYASQASGIIADRFMSAIKNGKDILIEHNLDTPIGYGYRDYAITKGYRTELHYIGVDDLNLLNNRIRERVDVYGLHYIDPENVKSKYIAALNILPLEILKFGKVVFFDNTKLQEEKLLELNEGKEVFKIKGTLPKWAQGVYDHYQKIETYQKKIRRKKIGNEDKGNNVKL